MCRQRSGLVICALLLVGAPAAGCQQNNCATVCRRVRTCEPQVTRALVERQPQRSAFMKSVRREMGAKLVGRLIKSCPQRCDALHRSKKWRKTLQSCARHTACDAFARCIAPTLEP